MPIITDKPNRKTICICDRCGKTEETDVADGVTISGWLTGQLWIDLSLSQQRQQAINFCLECNDYIANATTIKINGDGATEAKAEVPAYTPPVAPAAPEAVAEAPVVDSANEPETDSANQPETDSANELEAGSDEQVTDTTGDSTTDTTADAVSEPVSASAPTTEGDTAETVAPATDAVSEPEAEPEVEEPEPVIDVVQPKTTDTEDTTDAEEALFLEADEISEDDENILDEPPPVIETASDETATEDVSKTAA
jgi:hypothetical protein